MIDQKNFQKQQNRVFSNKRTEKLFGANDSTSRNVLFANGEDWKRQRKSMDPAFYNLQNYSIIFDQKKKKKIYWWNILKKINLLMTFKIYHKN